MTRVVGEKMIPRAARSLIISILRILDYRDIYICLSLYLDFPDNVRVRGCSERSAAFVLHEERAELLPPFSYKKTREKLGNPSNAWPGCPSVDVCSLPTIFLERCLCLQTRVDCRDPRRGLYEPEH